MEFSRTKRLFQFSSDLSKRLESKLFNKKGLFYIGWQGRGNIGDDSIYLGIQSLYTKLCWLPLLEGRKDLIVKKLGLDGVDLASQAVLGGGTLISTQYYLNIVEKAMDSGLPVWACGTGVGSCGWEQEEDPDLSCWRSPLMKFKGVGIRGPLSLKKLKDMGVGNAEIVGDLALALTIDRPTPAPPHQKILAVNVSTPDQSQTNETHLIEEIAEVARKKIEKGWQILPLAMDYRDLKPLQHFCQITDLNPSSIIYTNPLKVIGILSRCTALLGVRLHSAILAACASTPPVLLGYRSKCLDFMSSIDCENMHIPISELTSEQLIEQSVERIDSIEKEKELRQKIHAQALHWKIVQKAFVEKMIES